MSGVDVLRLFALIPAVVIGAALAAGLAMVALVSLYALVRPHVVPLVDAWIDWVYRRLYG